MKRLLLTLAVVPLAACEPTAQNAQQQRAAEKFDQAFATLDVTAGGARDVKLAPDSPAIEVHREKRLAEAAGHVKDLTSNGRVPQQVAARQLVAEAHAAAARLAWRDAANAWARQSALASQLTSTASAMALANRTAAEQAKVKLDEPIAQLRSSEDEAANRRDELMRAIAQVQEEIDTQQKLINEANALRDAKAAKAGELERKAFEAAGQLRYDLTVQAANVMREADQASARAELAKAKLDIAQAELAVLNAQLENVGEQLQQTKQAIQDLQTRGRTLSDMTTSESQRAAALSKELGEMFQQLAENQEQLVTKPLEQAAREYDAALQELMAAKSAAGSSPVVQLAETSMRAEFGHLQHKASMTHAGYQNLLATLATAAAGSTQQANAMREAAQAAGTRAEAAMSAARDALVGAASDLQTVASDARNSGDKDLERAALRQLITVNLALSTISGEPSFKTKAQEHQTRLNELKA